MTIHIYRCKRCGHEWPSKEERPVTCPNPKCRTPYWDRERVRIKKEEK